ncbi:MAG: 1,4-alpha-glucan branching protein GlgB [Lachnospiraceae bacterium]|nr:1,4-alpha-glucan branching protein GlgB [Lachnospiraceae bacterium]
MALSFEQIRALVEGRHRDPHTVLGPHAEDAGMAVRALNPEAAALTVLLRAGDEEPLRFDMNKIDGSGLYEAVIPAEAWEAAGEAAADSAAGEASGAAPALRYRLETENADGTRWTAYDPYAFPPGISDMDIYLFGQGLHYQIYEKLGANPMTMDGVPGVLFGVWAPNAIRVSVVGDFNGWDGRRHGMRRLDDGVWEIFIPGLTNGDRYKFEILTQTGTLIYKSDPYGKWSEMRPGTASRVWDIRDYEWQDEAWMNGPRLEDKIAAPMNIYEVHLGSWMRKPDGNFMSYGDIAERLVAYVKQEGFNYIELLPVMEHPLDESWGYQVTGYFAATSRFGDPAGFMYLVDLCHRNGIGVILDWVPAHFPKDSHGLEKFDGLALYEHADPRQGEHPEWGTLIFNYGRNEVKNFLIANALYWLNAFHADGLRVDAVASMLYLDYGKKDGEWIANEYGGNHNLEAVGFLKHMNSVIGGLAPGTVMIAEESTAWPGVTGDLNEDGLGFTFKWNMGWMHDFLGYMGEEEEHRKYHHNEMTFASTYIYSENYILVLSHDEVVHMKSAMIGKMPGDEWRRFANLRAAYGFMYAHPGKKLLFMGGEIGQYSEWNEGRELEWDLLQYDFHAGLQRFVADLGRVYQEQNALWSLDQDGFGFEWINADNAEQSVYSFIRRGQTKEDTLVVIANFRSEAYEDYKVGVPFAGSWTEILNSDAAEYGGSGVTNGSSAADREAGVPRVIESEESECDYRENSVRIRLAPLSVTVLKCVE